MNKVQKTILIIAASQAERQNICHALPQAGEVTYLPVEVENGAQTLACLSQLQPDCLLLDDHLPDYDVVLLLQTIVQQATPRIYPVVLLLSDNSTTLMIQALQHGVQDFLPKGALTNEQLAHTLTNAIKKVAQLRQEAEEREWFRHALTSLGDAVIATDQVGNVRFMNPVAEALVGQPASAAQGQPLSQILTLLDETNLQPLPNPIFWVLRTSQIIRQSNALLARQSGRELYIDYSAAPVADSQGNVSGVVLTLREASEPNADEQAHHAPAELARRYQAEIEAIYATVPLGLAVLDTELRFLRVNERLAEINGIPDAEHLGRTVRSIVPDLADKAEPLLRQVLATGQPILDLEIVGATTAQPDLQRAWLESFYPLYHDHGEVIGINVVVREITERKRAEDALRASEARLDTILQNVPASVYLLTPDQRYLYVNRFYEQLAHVTNAEIQGKSIYDMFAPATAAALAANDQRALNAKTPIELEEYAPHEGELRTYRSIKVPLLDANGEPYALLGISLDNTEQKRAERNQRFLSELSFELSLLNDAGQIQQRVVERLGEYLGASRCRFNAIDLTADTSTLLADWSQPGLPPAADISPLTRSISPAYMANAQAGHTLVVADAATDSRAEVPHDLLLTRGFPAIIRVPCLRAGQWVASLHVGQTTPRQWRSDEVQLVENVLHHFWPLVEKAHAEQALRASEANFRAAIEHASDAIFIANDQRIYQEVNAAACALSGYSREELLGKQVEDLTPPLAQARLNEERLQLLAGNSQVSEWALLRKDGTIVPIEVNAKQLPDGRWQAIVRDIRIRKQAEAALHQSNAILNAVLEGSRDAIFVRDLAGRYLLVNSAGAEQVGLEREAILGRCYSELFSADEIAAIQRDDHPVLEQGQSIALEHWSEHKGVIRYWHTLKMPLRNVAGEIIGLISSARDITERKQAEVALRTNEARFRQLADAMPQIVWRTDRAGNIDYVNAQWLTYSGLTLTESFGQGLWPAVHPDELAANLAAWQAAVAAGVEYEAELRLRRADGAYRWFLERAVPIRDEQGVIQHWFGASTDIHEHKMAETRQRFLADLGETMVGIQAAEDLLQTVAQRLGEFLGVARSFFTELDHSQQQMIVHHNYHRPELASMAGSYPMADFDPRSVAAHEAGRTIVLADIPPTATPASGNVERYAEAQIRAMVSVPLLRAGRWIATLVVTHHEPRQWSAAEITLIQTVAERAWLAVENRRLFQETQTLLAQLEAMLTNTPVGMAFYDRDLRYVRINPALAALNNLPVSAHLGKRPSELWLVPNEFEDALAQILATGRTLVNVEYHDRLTDQDYLLNWFPVWVDGALRCVGVTAVDITERLRYERALQQANQTLDQRVQQRTAELERSNRELDQFAYVASHDLRAPLRAIDNLALWISQDAAALLPPPSQVHLGKLRSRVKRMEKLLDDLLAFSRAGRIRTHPMQVDTAALIRDISELLAPPPGFSIIPAAAMPVLRTERVPLETILRNLIGNAIKHHDRSDGKIQVTADEQEQMIEFAVRDDGPGIEPHYHQKIFELFQTLKPRDQVEGSGMGLAVVKKLLESYGGTITVDSAPGQGSTFRFTWPKSMETGQLSTEEPSVQPHRGSPPEVDATH